MAEGALQATKAVPIAARQKPAAGQAPTHAAVPRRKLARPGEAAERSAGARAARALRGAFPAQSQSPRQRYAGAQAPASLVFRCGAHACDCPAEVRLRAELPVSHPRDPAELEAERTADEVMRTPAGYMRPTRMAPAAVHQVLQSPGSPLPASARRDAEQRLGHDFGRVRVHTDAQAAESARAVEAHAYTVGSHVVFGTGRFAPSTSSGRHLLLHELVHTVQQTGSGAGIAPSSLPVSTPADPAEQEAERIATAALHGVRLSESPIWSIPAGRRAAMFAPLIAKTRTSGEDPAYSRLPKQSSQATKQQQGFDWIGALQRQVGNRAVATLLSSAPVAQPAATPGHSPLSYNTLPPPVQSICDEQAFNNWVAKDGPGVRVTLIGIYRLMEKIGFNWGKVPEVRWVGTGGLTLTPGEPLEAFREHLLSIGFKDVWLAKGTKDIWGLRRTVDAVGLHVRAKRDDLIEFHIDLHPPKWWALFGLWHAIMDKWLRGITHTPAELAKALHLEKEL